MNKVIKVEDLSKIYDLGLVGTGTLYKDINRAFDLMHKGESIRSVIEY